MRRQRHQTILVLGLILISTIVLAINVPLFEDPVSYSVGSYPIAVCCADFDNDGDLDLAAAIKGIDSISMHLNNNGDFSDQYYIPSGGERPLSICATEVNNDGNADLIVANYDSDNIAVKIGAGNGAFSHTYTYTLNSGTQSVCAADFNNDGYNDIAVGKGGSTDQMAILFNTGDGHFGTPTYYDAGENAGCICTEDFDQDGDMDVATSNTTDEVNDVSVFINDGTGSFASAVNYTTGSTTRSIASADLNGDDYPELVVCNLGEDNISILINNGSGVFTTINNHDTHHPTPRSVFLADLDLDFDIDIVVADGTDDVVSVFENVGAAIFTWSNQFSCGETPYFVTGADFNDDEDIDLVVANHIFTDGLISVLENRSSLLDYTVPAQNQLGIVPNTWLFAYFQYAMDDYSIDNSTFIVNASQTGRHEGYVYSSDPITCAHDPYNDFAPGETVTANLSKDILPDLPKRGIGGYGLSHIWQFTIAASGDGSGSFGNETQYDLGSGTGSRSLYSADFDNDGARDLVTANSSTSEVSVFLNDGNGAFGTPTNYEVVGQPTSVISADFDNDFDLDLAVVCYGVINSVSILKNKGDGTFFPKVDYYAGWDPSSI